MSPAEITTRQQRRRSMMDVLRPLSIGSAVIATGLALVNLAGLVLGSETLMSWLGGTVPQKASTSLVMLVIGTALLLITSILSGLVIFTAIQLASHDRLEKKLRHDRDAEAYQRKKASEALGNLNLELENRVKVRTRALETANGELESFSYAVSHDLRAPLRAIEGFSRMVVERHAEDLPEQGRHYLQRVRAASNRMAEIIDGLLDLSRLSRGDLKTDDVDLTQLAGEIVEDLRAADPDRSADVSIQSGLHTIGDRRLLTAMLQNLIANAWKFTSGKDRAVIEVGAKSDAEHPCFYVRDNGAGFKPEHAQKLFQPFQRLHTVDEFEGTGLGLAIVQRVANRHGGSVWAEGEVGKGATFWFSLPVSESGHLPRSSNVTDFPDTADGKQGANPGVRTNREGVEADGR